MVAALALCSNAGAGLYGFSSANPPTHEESILDIATPPRYIPNFRQKIRSNIDMIANYAHDQNPDFQIVLHEGEDMLKKNLWEYHLSGYNKVRNHSDPNDDPSFLYRNTDEDTSGALRPEELPKFRQKIDGIALNNVFCHGRKISTDLKSSGLKLISIDHCSSPENYEEALQEAFGENILFYGFTNPDLAFNNINRRHIISENAKNIFNIQDAKNILFLTDDSKYKTSYDFIRNLQNSNYDIIVIPALFHGTEPFSPEDINSLKFKKNGTTRLVLAEMNLSEADPKMYYFPPASTNHFLSTDEVRTTLESSSPSCHRYQPSKGCKSKNATHHFLYNRHTCQTLQLFRQNRLRYFSSMLRPVWNR